MLEVLDLVVRYGAATALDGVSLHVERGQMVALVGPNGAGKSTLLNTICGVLRPASGTYRVAGRVAQVPEGRQLFAGMTVDDNLRLGAWSVRDRDPTRVYALFPPLVGLARRVAGTLSGGEQQMVAVGRALMAQPDLLAVDELSLGLAPMVVDDLAEHLVRLNRDRGRLLTYLRLHTARRGRWWSLADVGAVGGTECSAGARVVFASLRPRSRPHRPERHLGRPPRQPSRPGRLPRRSSGRSRVRLFLQYASSGVATGCAFALVARGLWRSIE